MRVRLSDSTLADEFLDFLWRSGFVAQLEAPDTAVVSLPMTLGSDRTQAELDLFLSVWLNISVRVWAELWPESDAIVLSAAEPARRAG